MFTTPDNTTAQLTMEVQKLSIEEQRILLMHLRKREIYARAKAYDKANKPPKLSNLELSDIVKTVRKKMTK